MYATLLQEASQWCPWCGDHMTWGGGWFMGLFSVAVLVSLVTLVWALVRSTPTRGGLNESPSAEEIVRRRYARGEIDEDTFRRMIGELRDG